MSTRQMLINYVPGEECRIAIIEKGQLEELYQERAGSQSHVGNIYKGRVVNVEPAIQAAFIEFGLERNGFLHVSDLHPKYFRGDAKEDAERVGMKTPRSQRPPIQQCLRRGQEILVQVLKEGIGTKGPTLTSYLSIPGRFLVMMPDMERLGVSRKIEDDEARRQMRKLLDDLNPPEDFGFIIRTAGIDRTKTELRSDLTYLQRMWKAIDKRLQTPGIGELYTESDLVIRTIRDVFASDIDRIIVDHPEAARRAHDFLGIVSPRARSQVLVYRDPIPIFHRYDIERQIESINSNIVQMPSGGSLVIESTEALVAIDVNSGRMRDSRDAETTAYKTNLEAADEICRQLRLRDLGGVVVNDLIDMRQLKYRRDVEQRFRQNLKKDRARTRILAISQFGILEMTRQRMRPSLATSVYTDCPQCEATGRVKSTESVVLEVMRKLALAMCREQVARIELTVSPDVAFYLLNRHRQQLVKLEADYGKPVMVRVNGAGPIDTVQLVALDARNSQVDAQGIDNMPEPVLESPDGPRGSKRPAADEDEEPQDIDPAAETAGEEQEAQPVAAADDEATAAPRKRRRRRRRRGGANGAQKDAAASAAAPDDAPPDDAAAPDEAAPDAPAAPDDAPPAEAADDAPAETQAPKTKRRRSRRRRGGQTASNGDKTATDGKQEATDGDKPTADGEKPTTDGDKPATAGDKATTDGDRTTPGDEAERPKRPSRRRSRSRRPKKGPDATDQTTPGPQQEGNEQDPGLERPKQEP